MNLVDPLLALSAGSVVAVAATATGVEPSILALGSFVPLAILIVRDRLYAAFYLMPAFLCGMLASAGFPVAGLVLAALPAIVLGSLVLACASAWMAGTNRRAG